MRHKAQILFGLGIVMLILAALAFLSGHQGFGIKMIGFAFGIFFLGLFFYLHEMDNEKN